MTSRVFSSFWRFAEGVYGTPGVAEACLDLQDLDGGDIPMLLFAVFCGASGRGRLDEAHLKAATRAVMPWREGVIVRLRRIRRAMREPLGGLSDEILRNRIKRIELAAERRQMNFLCGLLPSARQGVSLADRTSDAIQNASAYLALLPERSPSDRQVLIELLTNAIKSGSEPV